MWIGRRRDTQRTHLVVSHLEHGVETQQRHADGEDGDVNTGEAHHDHVLPREGGCADFAFQVQRALDLLH